MPPPAPTHLLVKSCNFAGQQAVSAPHLLSNACTHGGALAQACILGVVVGLPEHLHWRVRDICPCRVEGIIEDVAALLLSSVFRPVSCCTADACIHKSGKLPQGDSNAGWARLGRTCLLQALTSHLGKEQQPRGKTCPARKEVSGAGNMLNAHKCH